MGKAKTITNLITGEVFYDNLHNKALSQNISCTSKMCSGSSMTMYSHADAAVSGAELEARAQEFLVQFYKDHDRSSELDARMTEVQDTIRRTGTYDLTYEELDYASTLAWRNSPRCPGRIQWKNLKLFDCRHLENLDEMFDAICNHIEYSTNGGNIKPAITVFPKRIPGDPVDKFRMWNKQLIAYAGHEQEDGSIKGDPAYKDFTKFCKRLGWTGTNGQYDVLPMILSSADGVPKLFIVPESIILRIQIHHPDYPALADVGMEWFALPAVCGFLFEAGGIQFPASPFSGWYSLPEVATRDLLDKQRYNFQDKIAAALGFDIETKSTLWQDRVNTELNIAVLQSYMKAGVAIVDHHTQSEQFMDHFRKEHKLRGGCPSDWVWIVPPESGSLTEVFHQEMLNYQLYPGFLFQDTLWLKYRFPGDKRMSVKGQVLGLYFAAQLIKKMLSKRPKAAIFYGTETGNSKRYAENIAKLLSGSHDAKIANIKSCGMAVLKKLMAQKALVSFVVSTFGNGDPATDARKFTFELQQLNQKTSKPLDRLNYTVFALGSTAYEHFCEYGKRLDRLLSRLGGNQLAPLGLCDELIHPDKTYKMWAKKFGKGAGLSDEIIEAATGAQLVSAPKATAQPSFTARIQEKSHLGSAKTMVLTVSFPNEAKIALGPGDHVGIYPKPRASEIRSFRRSSIIEAIETVSLGNEPWEAKNAPEKSKEEKDEIRVRWYSLASLPYEGSDKATVLFDLVISQVTFQTKDGRFMRGLCTGYLDDLEMGSPMSCLHRPMPTLKSVIGDGTKPIILIASGSGIAPLRPVWQLKANNSRATGDLIFFYGCKTRSDNLFEAETNGLVNRQVGYSRESNEVKRYVQDVVKANGKLVWEAIGKKSGAIFVCGKAEMADSVKKSLLEIFEANLKGETATNFMEKLKIACRYEEEIFGSSAA